MKNFYRSLFFFILIIIIMSMFFIPAPADTTQPEKAVAGNKTAEKLDNQTISSSKEPNSPLVFLDSPDEGNSTHNENQFKQENPNNSVTIGNATNSTSQYESLGEIIKAKDWKALSEYKCRIKTEKPQLFETTENSWSDKEAKWNSYFYTPPIQESISCCGA